MINETKKVMSIKEAFNGPAQHILEARQMAEGIHKNKPEIQREMLHEVKAYLLRLKEKDIEGLKDV